MRYSIIGATVQQVTSAGGTDIKEAKSTGIIFATLTEEQALILKSQGATLTTIGGVKAVVMAPIIAPPVPIAATPIYSPEELIWDTGLEDLRSIFSPPLYGEGMNIAIIGTGIRETHVKIAGRVVYRKNYTADPMRDDLDHDTGVCSIITTIAPLCNILNLKVLNEKGEGTEEEVVLAIDDCISFYDTKPEIFPSVINMSLGSPDDGNPNNILRVACRAAVKKGIWILASAGNSGPNPYSITCPACDRVVLAIGSVRYLPENNSFILSYFSSRGPTLEGLVKPEAVMFGEDISLASSVSDTAVIAKSGTSFATPFCSAIALLYKEGAYRRAVTTQVTVQLPATEIYYVSIEELVDRYLSLMCVKPQGVAPGKDNGYGEGLLFGPLVAKALKLVPAVDISTMLQPMMGIMMLGFLGMMIVPTTKTSK